MKESMYEVKRWFLPQCSCGQFFHNSENKAVAMFETEIEAIAFVRDPFFMAMFLRHNQAAGTNCIVRIHAVSVLVPKIINKTI